MLLQNIQAACAEKHISVAELERTLGIAERSITRWNKVMPSADKLLKVANELGTTVEFLLNGDKRMAGETNGNTYN